MKTCSRCRETKSRSDFTRRRSASDGLESYCRVCKGKAAAEYRARNKQGFTNEVPATKRCARCKLNKSSSDFSFERTSRDGLQGYCKSCKSLIVSIWSKTREGKASKRKADARQRAKNPHKIKARNAVNRAIRQGRLRPPTTLKCAYCDDHPGNQYHHHLGYDPEHWLDVIAVCIPCHNGKAAQGEDPQETPNQLAFVVSESI